MVRHRKVSAATGAWYPAGYYDSSWQNVSLRGGSADEFSIVCIDDGQLLGTADAARAFAQLHPGAIYLHQGDSYLVTELDLENGIACVTSDVPPWTTYSRANTQIHVERIREERHFGSGASSVTIGLADVTVVRQVKEYERKAETGEVIDVVDVDCRPRNYTRRLSTTMWIHYSSTTSVLRSRMCRVHCMRRSIPPLECCPSWWGVIVRILGVCQRRFMRIRGRQQCLCMTATRAGRAMRSVGIGR